jgi:hypothetical protein
MVETISRFVTDQLRAYDESNASQDPTSIDRWDVEARIKVAMAIFQVINDLDERLARDAISQGSNFDRRTSERIRELYAAWERPAARIVLQLKALWTRGMEVEGGDAFADAVLEARSMLHFSLDELDQRAAQLQRGEKRTMAEVMDGVRRRLGA